VATEVDKKTRTKGRPNEDSLIQVAHEIKEHPKRVAFLPLVGLHINAVFTRLAPPCFGSFWFSSEMILAPENDLLVDVVEDPIQVPGELSNPGQMDVSLHDFGTEKMGQLHLLETS
jgi:hypothetical protein